MSGPQQGIPMVSRMPEADGETYGRLRLLMLFRVLFTTLLLGSTVILQFGRGYSVLDPPLVTLYVLIASIFFLSLLYAVMLPRVGALARFAALQIGIDTFIVTSVIFVTGGFASIFSFLYLVVIIYSSMLQERGGSVVMAGLCSVQYAVLVNLEYYRLFSPFVLDATPAAMAYPWRNVLYKVLITTISCFAVAFLSDMLAEQARRSRKTIKAMEERVRRVEKLASMGEMAAGMAHELKNPLAALAGSIQLLGQERLDNPVHDRLIQIALRETRQLNDLLTNFLMFARPPAGKPKAMQLDRAVAEIVSLFERDGTRAGSIAIVRRLTPGLWVKMDPVHLKQVLWNLLLNAAEAIEGEGTITVEVEAERGTAVRIRIQDTGCGMSAELLGNIFNPFFTTKADGTGLGLSMVHRILESCNGWLTVDSEPGRGSVFTVTLPRISPPSVASAAQGDFVLNR